MNLHPQGGEKILDVIYRQNFYSSKVKEEFIFRTFLLGGADLELDLVPLDRLLLLLLLLLKDLYSTLGRIKHESERCDGAEPS